MSYYLKPLSSPLPGEEIVIVNAQSVAAMSSEEITVWGLGFRVRIPGFEGSVQGFEAGCVGICGGHMGKGRGYNYRDIKGLFWDITGLYTGT